MNQNHTALYGSTKLGRAWCEGCSGWALIVAGRLACCGDAVDAAPETWRRMTQASPNRRRMGPRVRAETHERQGGLCAYCGRLFDTPIIWRRRVTFIRMVIDHMAPFSHTRDDHLENLIGCCNVCNSFKSNLCFETVEEVCEHVKRCWDRNIRSGVIVEDVPGVRE